MTDNFQSWVGREQERTETILPAVAESMAATLDLQRAPRAGESLPPGWQWLFFNTPVRRSELGSDGHPRRGGFLPPIELPRRMWAGSRIQYLADVAIGAEATRRSRILKVVNKTGQSGSLWFVTVQHTITCAGDTCIVEEQDIVFREAARGAAPARTPERHPSEATWSRVVEPDTILLFRYSALTWNGHRIHYDQPYARNEECYRDLVVHGPLTATLLQQFALEVAAAGRSLARFEFRGVAPLLVDRSFQVEARPAENGALDLWARGPDGELAMSAAAFFR